MGPCRSSTYEELRDDSEIRAHEPRLCGCRERGRQSFAGADDYAFEPVNADIKSSNVATVAVRLVHKPSGKPVADATIVQTRLHMAPDGMADMATAIAPLSSPEPDVYAFK
jgi:hypothetical protein